MRHVQTELCRGWLDTGSCRYGAKCQVRTAVVRESLVLCFFTRDVAHLPDETPYVISGRILPMLGFRVRV